MININKHARIVTIDQRVSYKVIERLVALGWTIVFC